MGSAKSTLKVVDFATDFVPGVNLIKNTSIAIYDAATGNYDGAEKRAIAMLASAISTGTLGVGDEFVVFADTYMYAAEAEAILESGLSTTGLAAETVEMLINKAKSLYGSSPITVATTVIGWIAQTAYHEDTKNRANIEVLRSFQVQNSGDITANLSEDVVRWQWKIQYNVAMYDKADWGDWYKEENINLQDAIEMAHTQGFKGFTFVNQPMMLAQHGSFQTNTSIFFKNEQIATRPWLGPAPQCDYYRVYNVINELNDNDGWRLIESKNSGMVLDVQSPDCLTTSPKDGGDNQLWKWVGGATYGVDYGSAIINKTGVVLEIKD